MNENAHGESSGPRATPEVSVADTITIFFSDIRGFTDTTEELGDEVANDLVREQDFIVRSHIEAYGGGVVEYVDRGLHPLKGFPEPKRLFEVTWHATSGEQPAAEPALSSGDETQIAALKAAVQRAIGVLTRVLAITHMDDPGFPSLLE